MKNKKRLLSLLLVLCMVLPCFSAFAAADNCTVAFLGHNELKNELRTPYSVLLKDYLSDRVGKNVEIVKGAPIDFAAADFMNSVVYDVAPTNPDIVFMEINIGKKYPLTDAELSARLESMVLALCEGGRAPAIYFMYTPMDNFLDYRAPYDKVAERYGIEVIDAYTYFKEAFEKGHMRTADFLNYGEKPSEDGQEHYVTVVKNELYDVEDITKGINADVKPISSVRHVPVTIEAAPEVEEVANGITLFVDGKVGSDSNSGTKEMPLKTVVAARNKLRTLKKQQGKDFKGATVYIREGLYILEDGLKLNEEDSAIDGTRIVYEAYNGEEVRFTNARPLNPKDFAPVTDTKVLERFHTDGLGHILQYNLKGRGIPAGRYLITLRDPDTYFEMSNPSAASTVIGNILIANGKSQMHARYPNGGDMQIASHQDSDRTHFAYSGTRDPERWNTTSGQAYIRSVTSSGYFTFYNRFIGTDAENKFVKCAKANTYAPKAGWVWSAVNLLEELDVPGEMCVEESTGTLYYYPHEDFYESELLFVGGNLNSVVLMDHVKNVTFKGITFEGSNKHGLEIIDSTATITDGCTFRNLGGAAVYLTNSGSAKYGRNGFMNCHIYNVYAGGIYIIGGDRATLVPQKDYVYNCHFENYDMAFHHGSSAVHCSGGAVGVDIYNNFFHNDDTTAVNLNGINHNIYYNEFSNVVKESDDTGAIYGQSSGITDQGFYIRYNYFHDIIWYMEQGTKHVSVSAIYPDAMGTYGTEVTHNVFNRVDNAFFNSTSKNQTVSNNIVLDGYAKQFNFNEAYYGVSDGVLVDNEWVMNSYLNNELEQYRGKGSIPTQYLEHFLFYHSYLNNLQFTGENVKNYYREFPWLENYFGEDKNIFRATDCIMEKNAVYRDRELNLKQPASTYALLGGAGINRSISTGNNFISDERFLDLNGNTDVETDYLRLQAAMDDAAKNIDGFETWDITKAGLVDEPKPVGSYNMLSPINGKKEADITNLRLCWEYASGADEYDVEVATDSEFTNIVFSGSARNNYITVPGLEQGAKTYYWRVKAKSFSKSFYGTPAPDNGPYFTFTSMRYKTPELGDLAATLEAAREIYDAAVEGTQPGQYQAGSKETLLQEINSAQAVADNKRVEQNAVNNAQKNLREAHIAFLKKVNLGELDVFSLFNDVTKVEIGGGMGGGASPAVEGEKMKITSDAFAITEPAMFYSADSVGAHNILHFKGTFDFASSTGATGFFIVATNVKNHGQYPWNNKSYAFLVTATNIELQSFAKGGSATNVYLTVPNKTIKSGVEHDIEFAAIPVSKGVRLILRVDGELVYDYVDMEKFIEGGGDVELYSNIPNGKLIVASPDKDLPYPSLYELIKDNPEAELN